MYKHLSSRMCLCTVNISTVVLLSLHPEVVEIMDKGLYSKSCLCKINISTVILFILDPEVVEACIFIFKDLLVYDISTVVLFTLHRKVVEALTKMYIQRFACVQYINSGNKFSLHLGVVVIMQR